jgi:tetratricopeptide (TPR) repeat protein
MKKRQESLKKPSVVLIYFFLALACIIAFANVLECGFINFDDDTYVTENSRVNGGFSWGSVVWAFTTSHFSNWHPLTWLSHMADCQFFGIKARGHHLTNLLFHIANTLLLFAVLKKMTGAIWASAFAASFFALHPLHVESVAWVSERKDVLSGFFWMLTIAFYIRYTERVCVGRYLAVFLVLCLGLMSKAMLVTLPFVLLLLDYWPLNRFCRVSEGTVKTRSKSKSVDGHSELSIGQLIVEKIPMFVVVLISCVVTYLVQQSGGATKMVENLPLNIRMSNALVSYVSYMGKMFWPMRLAILYPHPEEIAMWKPISSLLVLAGITAGVVFSKRRYLVVGWLWYVGTLVPVIGLVQVGRQAMADRYSYLPLIGLFIMVVWGAIEIIGQRRNLQIVLRIVGVLLVFSILIVTRMQVKHWKDDFSLYTHTLNVTENNYTIHTNLGAAYKSQGDLAMAMKHYRQSLEIKPDFYEAQYNLGNALRVQEKYDEAISCYRKALEIKPDYVEVHKNLGGTLYIQDKLEEAIEHYHKALQIDPDNLEVLNNLGVVLRGQGQLEQSIKYFRKTIKLAPNHAKTYYNLGFALQLQGKLDEAIEQYRIAIKIDPYFRKAHKFLSAALAEQEKR